MLLLCDITLSSRFTYYIQKIKQTIFKYKNRNKISDSPILLMIKHLKLVDDEV